MCGIVGYIGPREAYPIIIKGLKRLEYRGYDSAGLALFDGEKFASSKTKGKVSDLEERAETEQTTKGSMGIGHTRWATHRSEERRVGKECRARWEEDDEEKKKIK